MGDRGTEEEVHTTGPGPLQSVQVVPGILGVWSWGKAVVLCDL